MEETKRTEEQIHAEYEALTPKLGDVSFKIELSNSNLQALQKEKNEIVSRMYALKQELAKLSPTGVINVA